MNKIHRVPENLVNYPIIYEDYANDTGVAVARVSVYLNQKYENQNITTFFLPADHYIGKLDNFVQDMIQGIQKVTDNNIVLFGIEPNFPNPGYGYILANGRKINFKEKPNIELAIQLLQQGALWNSGIFATKLYTLLAAFAETNLLDWVYNPRTGKAPSFDVAILQQHQEITLQSCSDWCWSDIGTWRSFLEIPEIQGEIDRQQNKISSNCDNVQILNRGTGKIVAIGCQNLTIIAADNNFLVIDNTTDHSNELKTIANDF